MIRLGVNIDHIATVRQARRTVDPDPVEAAVLAELAGADGITVHLRQDRRHIQERDVRLLRQVVKGTLNLEMAVGEDVLGLVLEVRPHAVCLVPERREELTTEGGLSLHRDDDALHRAIHALKAANIQVSLFIDPDENTIRLAKDLGTDAIELHTGAWANAWMSHHHDHGPIQAVRHELERLERGAAVAAELGLALHAGHGLTYRNVREILHLPLLRELNIGHNIIARAVMTGMEEAVRDMRTLIDAGAR